MDDTEENIAADRITAEEVQTAIGKLKNRKSPGIDNITNEMIRYGGHELIIQIAHLFRVIEKTGRIPKEWKTSITMPIFKKGMKCDPVNYRGITLLSSVAKLLTKILTKKITDKVPMCEEQQGFRSNRSTLDAIFILQQLIEKSVEFNKPMFVCFVDLKQAFDRIRLRNVITILRQGKVSHLDKIKELNTSNKTKKKQIKG